MTHTLEPWSYAKDTYGVPRIWAIADGEECDVATLAGDGSLSPEEQNANAVRVVACINGCLGLNPAAYRACVEALRGALNALQQHGAQHHPKVQTDIQQALAQAKEQDGR